jgi:flagellar hook-associated protein 3 FlgL
VATVDLNGVDTSVQADVVDAFDTAVSFVASGANIASVTDNGNSLTITTNAGGTSEIRIDTGSATNTSGQFDIAAGAASQDAGGGDGVFALDGVDSEYYTGTSNDTLAYSLSINGTVVYSVDESGTPVSNLTDLAAVINDDSGTTGVTAYVAGSDLFLVPDNPGTTVTVTETMSGYTPGDNDEVIGYFGSILNGNSDPSVDNVMTPDDANHYLVLDSADNIEASGDYAEDAFISFNGVQTSFKGEPHSGDRFSITPSSNQDVFTTLQNLVDTLRSAGGTEPDRAEFHNAMNRFLADINQAQDHLSALRSQVGGRLNTIDDEVDNNEVASLQMQEALSREEDLDYAQAATDFNLQLIALQAAQQAFVRVQNLSLFNFLN